MMSATGPEHASTPGPQTLKLFKCSGLQGIRDEIEKLAAAGLYAIPIRLYWKDGKKQADYPRRWAHIKDPDSWRQSSESPLQQVQPGANGVAILTEVSNLMVIDIDVAGDVILSRDATTEPPVDPHDDMQVITQYTRGTREVQDLLLKIVVEHAAPKAYANLGRLFAYMYMIEGRILATTNDAEKSRESHFFFWNGSSWIQDTCNMVTSVFTSQMGCLLAWYERQQERYLGTLYSKHRDLQGYVVDGNLKHLDIEEVNSTVLKRIRMATEACIKERDESMPSFGKINVQDIVDVRKCMHSVVNKLHVPGLLDMFDQDRMVVNAPNGLIDLQTGALLPHHPQDLCNNMTCGYIQGASTRSTARFRKFLMAHVLPPNAIAWLQLLLGYCLTGEISEELFIIAVGLAGANGKGVLQRALRRAMGTYNCAGNKAIFIKPTFKANASAASTHLMQIRTKRFVTNCEADGSEELHATFVKEASGGDELDARELFCKPQSYVPQYKLCLFTNYMPHFPGDDTALLRGLCS
ncbi:hypothetical protein KFL_002040050 [Klebsormidium nitens]|uniref:Bacteriophage/plasmid primase P4 C-terminal domain-containing protein n=1 Tax=Klebsormidium nitens TaxID=105231 RepID=A0A1Y1I7T3_KLENI|nr:hypothetical protein KFL_002040050 [Klebsormidium nitens]|eukprot:GAQ84746.1 hypothetical protein KFL_002040050 [Klebsormidium nitens]